MKSFGRRSGNPVAMHADAIFDYSCTAVLMNISSYLPADDQNTTRAGGNNPRARCAIDSRDTVIICSVPPLTGKNQFIKISAWEEVMSRAKYFS